ncbi:glutathione synthetase [Sphingomonas sp. LY29]|uniref:glutathione synthetase n=1 Tax=unclassified Sphingomonas TaxID=196159 RepID=UPI002ADED9D0|nr:MULTISPECIES: glutathione synthetase [unclassified Sphingomonas]MEA1072273.1 glutathione synthetase [Sphingomonas sp. LY160]WRP25057.1 glutathione synthetase [Sphingomonas sp. LY29]
MLIAFFVNDMEREFAGYTTTVLAYEAALRGHRVCYVTPSDFALQPDDSLCVHGRFLPKKKYKDREDFFKTMRSAATKLEQVNMDDVDVLMLRSDPSLDAQTMPWAAEAGILFGREAAKRGVIVLNDPDSLGRATNKLYFQSFPVEARAETLISRHDNDIKAFAKKHGGNIILKPLQGSGGSGVFKLDPGNKANLNQMIEAIGRDGYIIAQAYVPAAKKGDIRFFLMNGRPLEIDGKYAALRRVASKDDIRSNIHAGGTAEAVEIGETELKVAELIRPKLVADGMFLVGIDIVGDKILEVNVFSPGNLGSCSRLAGVDFAVPIIDAMERKVAIKSDYAHAFDNRQLAVL